MTATAHSTQPPKPGRSPAFQCYAKDLYTGTSDLSAAEFGTYWRGVCWSWDNGPLPNRPEPRRRALMLTPKEFRSIWPVIKPLWKKVARGYINVRLEAVRKEQDDFFEQKRQAGLNSAAAKAAAKAQREANTVDVSLPTESQREVNPSSASSSASSKKIKPIAADAAPTRTLLTLFSGLFEERIGRKPVINGAKDTKLLADLWRELGENMAEVERLMRLFFGSKDEWIMASGYTVGVFRSQINKLLSQQAPLANRQSGVDEQVRGLCESVGLNNYTIESFFTGARLEGTVLYLPDSDARGYVERNYLPTLRGKVAALELAS